MTIIPKTQTCREIVVLQTNRSIDVLNLLNFYFTMLGNVQFKSIFKARGVGARGRGNVRRE